VIILSVSAAFDDVAGILSGFMKKNTWMLLTCDPPIADFRKPYEGVICLKGNNGDGVRLRIPKENLASFVGILTECVFNKPGTYVYTWDIKKLFSYFYHRLNREYHISLGSSIIDLKYAEAFWGSTYGQPKEMFEVSDRVKRAPEGFWNKIHWPIHIPLATRVLPKIETAGITDKSYKGIRYSSYEIEGQVNGRLRCFNEFSNGILAHNLRPEDRENLRAARLDHQFVVLDFKAMEVCVLQSLSSDEKLGRIIDSGRDIYSTIYSLLYGFKCTDANRQFIKAVFLPIVYGLQEDSLVSRLGLSHAEARTLNKNIRKNFPQMMDWMDRVEAQARAGQKVYDYCGRGRHFSDKPWTARNASVQGPAAIVCMEKLISLYDAMRGLCEIVATIHDGYILDVPKQNLQEIVYRAEEILTSKSNQLPGVRLSVDIKEGSSLAELKQM
jgi:hypothetical protein